MRDCPACRASWPDEREVCPRCLAALVEDIDATITCRSCGSVCPTRMHSCPSCFALLRTEDIVVDVAAEEVLAAGGHLRRPLGRSPFSMGPGSSLRRLRPCGGLVVLGADGLIEGGLRGAGIAARVPLVCSSGDEVLFRLNAYGAAAAAVVAVRADGAPLATFLREGRLRSTIQVRDATSAPVASLRRGESEGALDVVETGGQAIGCVWRSEAAWEDWEDDDWTFVPGVSRLPMPTLAWVALVAACKVLLGRPEPTRRRDEERAPNWTDLVD